MLLFKFNEIIIDRSLTIKRPTGHSDETTESLLYIFFQLAQGGFLNTNRIFILHELDWSHDDQFIRDICSMKNLESLDLLDCELTMKDLGSVLRSCSGLTKLCLKGMEMSLERKFVDPVNWSNVILSGISKGFENVHKEIDPQQRYCEHLTLMLCKK
jgi:hypothetical protein